MNDRNFEKVKNNPELYKLFPTILQNAIIKALEEIKCSETYINQVLTILNSGYEIDDNQTQIHAQHSYLSGWNRLKHSDLKVFKDIESKLGISLEFLRELANVLTFKRAEYIQLLDMFLDSYTLNGVKLKSTMDQELETRFLVDYLIQLEVILKLNLIDLVSSSFGLKFATQDINKLYERWKENYIQNPMAYISLSNTEIQESIRLCAKYGSEAEKKQRIELIESLDKALNWISDGKIYFDFQNTNQEFLSEEKQISANTTSIDLITGGETILKRASSVIKKLINNRNSDQVFKIEDFFQIVNDIGRSTKLFDSLGTLSFEEKVQLNLETRQNLEKIFDEYVEINLNGSKYKVLDRLIQNLVKYKITYFSDLSVEMSLVLYDSKSKNYLFFKPEVQAQTVKALNVKHLEDPLYAYRKDLRTSLKNLENFDIFINFLKKLNINLQPKYFKLLGLSNVFTKSGLNIEGFIESREYANLYYDTFLARFPTTILFILNLLHDHEDRSKIFRFMQNVIPLSYAMRRSIYEAREIYKGSGVLDSAEEAEKLYQALIEAKIDNVVRDIVDLNLDGVATLKPNTENIIYDQIEIGNLTVWSKLLLRPKEKVLEGINLLLAPNWHNGSNGTEKIPQSNTRFVLINQKNEIALIINSKYKEIDLIGSDTINLVNEDAKYDLWPSLEKYDIKKIKSKIEQKLGLSSEVELNFLEPPSKVENVGFILLTKKVKYINLIKFKVQIDSDSVGSDVIWIDPIELFIWKYWLNKDLHQRPEKYAIPLAPYSTFTEKIIIDLNFIVGVKYDRYMISKIKEMVRKSKGSISAKEIRNQIINIYDLESKV